MYTHNIYIYNILQCHWFVPIFAAEYENQGLLLLQTFNLVVVLSGLGGLKSTCAMPLTLVPPNTHTHLQTPP